MSLLSSCQPYRSSQDDGLELLRQLGLPPEQRTLPISTENEPVLIPSLIPLAALPTTTSPSSGPHLNFSDYWERLKTSEQKALPEDDASQELFFKYDDLSSLPKPFLSLHKPSPFDFPSYSSRTISSPLYLDGGFSLDQVMRDKQQEDDRFTLGPFKRLIRHYILDNAEFIPVVATAKLAYDGIEDVMSKPFSNMRVGLEALVDVHKIGLELKVKSKSLDAGWSVERSYSEDRTQLFLRFKF